jgi:hypothetical protein
VRLTLVGLLAVLALVMPAAQGAHAQTMRTHTVQQILVDGKAVDSANGVTVTPPNARPDDIQHVIRRTEQINDGTRVDVPARIEVVIVSTGGTSTATLEPGASDTFVSTDKGELVRSNAGKTLFEVVHNKLDFFRVQYGAQITAGVSGTTFSVEASAGQVTFACTQDAVAITKTGYLQIGADRRHVSLTDAISAAHVARVTYAPSPSWTLGTFTDYPSAQGYYQQQAAAASKAGDTAAEAAALNNLGLIASIAENSVSARQYFAQSAQLGNPEAQTAIGLMYQSGTDATPQNNVTALGYYDLAAAQGAPEGLRRAACLYVLGPPGVPANDAKALQDFQLAAAQGDYLSAYYAGLMYESGTAATPKDLTTALDYVRRAAVLAKAAGITQFSMTELLSPPAYVPGVICQRG